ncbi:hypothetical protein ScPMuIL_014967 [Solemya velum]
MFGRYGMAFYDATNTRVRIVEEVKEGSSDNFYDKLDLFNIQRRYVVNLKTRVCNTTSLTRPFRPFAVPFDARFETQANLGVIGNQQEEVTVQNFSGNTTDGGRYLIGVSSPDCLPIYDFYNSNSTGFVRTNFFDLTMGIVDPSIFIPPRECSPTLRCGRHWNQTLVAAPHPLGSLQMSPKQWQGRQITFDPSKQFEEFAEISYDEVNKRIRVIEEVRIGTKKEFFDVLELFNEQRRYVLDMATRKCNVTTLTFPFIPFGVPPDAVFDAEATIGAAGVPGEQLVIQSFNGNTTEGGQYVVGVSSPSCVPVYLFYNSQRTGFVQRNFFDLEMGIPDPSVFIPPTECV